MGDHESNQKLSLPFGDVIKRVALAIYSQLQNVLHNMRIQSPELRTQSLLAFISRSKKKLAQLLAITRWLDTAGVSQFFANMSVLQLKISTRENRLNENQDGLYFTHSQLFSRKIRSLDVVSAKDILARGTYPHLPASIFSCGRPSETTLESENFAEISLIKSLNIFLRSKLALGDDVPSNIDYSSIENGMLTIRVNNMYELILTLDYLDTESPWNVLRLSICVVSHDRESYHSQQNLSGVENKILMILRRIAETSSVSDVQPLSIVANGAIAPLLIESGSITATIPSSAAADGNVGGFCSSAAPPAALLPRFHIICQHAAYATALRYLYVQALETSRTIWLGICEAEFQEKRNYSQFVFRFWKSHMTGYYQYELRVIQLRSPHQTHSLLDIETVVVDSDGKEIGGDVGLTADVRDLSREVSASTTGASIPLVETFPRSNTIKHTPKLIVELWTCSAPDDSEGALKRTRRRVKENPSEAPITADTADAQTRSSSGSEAFGGHARSCPRDKEGADMGLFDATEFIINGVAFSGMLQKVLELCAENRLSVLHRRLLKTQGVLSALLNAQSKFSLSPKPSSLIASVGEARLTVHVDSLSGKFSVGSNQLSGVTKGASRDCSLFLSEVNNIASEQLAGQIHTVEPFSSLPTAPLPPSSSSSATTSSLSSAMDIASDDGVSVATDFNINFYLRPLSTAANMVQYLAAAHWAGMVKRASFMENEELHAVSLYSSALSHCTASTAHASDRENGNHGSAAEDDAAPSRVIPLVYELCSWTVECGNQRNGTSSLSAASISNISSAMRLITDPTVAPAPVPPPATLGERLNEMSYTMRSIEASTATGNEAIDDAAVRMSLVFCVAVDDSLGPKFYALLCSKSVGATMFLPPTVIKATVLKFDFNRCLSGDYGSSLDDNLVVKEIEGALVSASKWATSSFDTSTRLSAFGLYLPPTVSDPAAATATAVAPLSVRSTIVMWSDAVSLLTIQFDTCNGDDDSTVNVSLLCPIPLPGVGTLGISGPPRCVVGVPRNVTSEEADRMKRRCISIGEIPLTIRKRVVKAENNEVTTDLDSHAAKRKRAAPASYSFQCGKLVFLEAFFAMSGLVQNDLYSALAQETLQHSFDRHFFSAPLPQHRPGICVLDPLNKLGEEDNDVLSSLCNAYCTSRPLLEFILLASNCPAAPTGTPASNGAKITCKGMLKVLSLDCTSRSEPFIVCALYEASSDTQNSSSASRLHLVGFLEVVTSRSSTSVTDMPDTPRARSGSNNYNLDSLACNSIDELVTRKIEKVVLKVSSLTCSFEDQVVEMEVFRECFQKKLQAMSGRNPFHAFINKLIAFYTTKCVTPQKS